MTFPAFKGLPSKDCLQRTVEIKISGGQAAGGTAGPECGDGSCNGDETCDTCQDDCGACQSCTFDWECISGHCVHNVCRPTDPYCGDGYCDYGESSTSCPADCGSVCSDGECDLREECSDDCIACFEENCFPSEVYCNDGVDNDQDDYTDCAEVYALPPECDGQMGPCGECDFMEDDSPEMCSDGCDNDGDGLIDCQDDGCNEYYELCNCTDGIDNDGDGDVDCDDDECSC